MKLAGNLSKREHQIMDLTYERGEVGSGELETLMPEAPSNSAIRAHLRSLEAKGLLVHREHNGKFFYSPTKPREDVAQVEFTRLIKTFFGGSITSAFATLLDQDRDHLTKENLDELRRMIDQASKEGR
jgi:BlaI family penicillinase repressor